MKIALCLRGHIRDGLIDSGLRKFIDFLQSHDFTVDIYLHTWLESEAKSSYRNLDHNYVFDVSTKFLQYYFKNYNVAKITIEDDNQIDLFGNIEGNVCLSCCPLLAWKRMWAGKYNAIKAIYDSGIDYDLVINTRYDNFTNPLSIMSNSQIYRLLHHPGFLKFKYPKLRGDIIGVDNLYCGHVSNMTKLAYDFHYDLDNILNEYPNTRHQEEMVYKYAVDNNLDTVLYENSFLHTRTCS